MDWLLEAACAQAGLPLSPSVADGVEVVCRTDGTRDWLFVLNYRDEDVRVPLERPGIDLLTGAAARESLELAGRGAAVLALDPRPARGSGRGRPKARPGR
jgi:beta-galactosidase